MPVKNFAMQFITLCIAFFCIWLGVVMIPDMRKTYSLSALRYFINKYYTEPVAKLRLGHKMQPWEILLWLLEAALKIGLYVVFGGLWVSSFILGIRILAGLTSKWFG